MKISEKRISSGLWAYLFFFIALEPAYFQHIKITDRIFVLMQIAMFGCMVILRCLPYFRMTKIRRTGECKEPSRIVLLLFVYYSWLLAVTIFNGGRTSSILWQAIQFCGFVLYLDTVLKNNPSALFKNGLNLLSFYLVLNCCAVFLIPHGLYATSYFTSNYFFGYRNQNINFILPALVLVVLKDICYRKCKLQIVVLYTVAFLTAIKVWSAATLIVLSFMSIVVLCYMVCGKNKFIAMHIFTDKIFNFFTLLAINIVCFFGLVFLRLQFYFEYFITVVLKKKLTLSGRTTLWDRTMEFIKKNPILGYGKEVYTERAVKFGYSSNMPQGLHAHNRFLETIYSGGVILLGLYLYMLVYAAFCLKRIKKTNFAKILSFGIFVYMIGMLTELYDYCIFFWGMLVIAENAEGILNKLNG